MMSDERDIHEKSDFLTTNIKISISEFVKSVNIRSDDKPWYGSDLHRQRIDRKDAYERAVYIEIF